MNLKNSKLYIGLLVIIVVAIFLVPRLFSDGGSSVVYMTAKVDRNNITSQITSSGTINPLKTIEVGTQVAGYAKNIFVDYNTEVKKGDPLLEIDPSRLQTELKRSQADNKNEVPPGMISGYNIAVEELKSKKIPFIIRRPIPNGGNEFWKLEDLEILNSY